LTVWLIISCVFYGIFLYDGLLFFLGRFHLYGKVVDEDGLGEHAGGTSVVILMVRDAYANYVVQTTLDVVAEGTERRLLLKELNAHSAQLRNYTFAKHIMTKLSS